jgi:SAM-dependent methyltransferase
MPPSPSKRTDRPHGVGETDYKRCWNSIAESLENAYSMIDESRGEEELVAHGKSLADALTFGLDLGPEDRVLDIGCGVARIGREIAPRVREWIGVDVSENMLEIAARRTTGLPNCRLLAVGGADLAPIESESVDKIYCHSVFIHMDKEDVYAYLAEARRVIRPGGLFYFDVWNLCDDAGWLRWELERAMYRARADRPIHRSQFSTPDEVRTLLRRSGWMTLQLAESYALQAVATRAKDDEDPASFRVSMERRFSAHYSRLALAEDDVRDFRRIISQRLRDRGVV